MTVKIKIHPDFELARLNYADKQFHARFPNTQTDEEAYTLWQTSQALAFYVSHIRKDKIAAESRLNKVLTNRHLAAAFLVKTKRFNTAVFGHEAQDADNSLRCALLIMMRHRGHFVKFPRFAPEDRAALEQCFDLTKGGAPIYKDIYDSSRTILGTLYDYMDACRENKANGLYVPAAPTGQLTTALN